MLCKAHARDHEKRKKNTSKCCCIPSRVTNLLRNCLWYGMVDDVAAVFSLFADRKLRRIFLCSHMHPDSQTLPFSRLPDILEAISEFDTESSVDHSSAHVHVHIRMDARLIEGMAGVSEEQQLQRAMAASRYVVQRVPRYRFA